MDVDQESAAPKWKPLGTTERRVLGVLIEKAKTTPDNYPITLASLTAGCNQKSNRAPQMQLNDDDVDLSLDRLRSVGVAVEVQGSGRVPKYRHTAYDWFDVKGPEIAVLTELLLRGEQTAGELRTRASRMEPFQDLAALQPVLQMLLDKNLIVALTPPGRGQLFTHNLYPDADLAHLRKKITGDSSSPSPQPVAVASQPATPVAAAAAVAPANDELQSMRDEIARLSEEVAQLKQRLDILES
ncbi:YceH family protein [Rosistilla oblonga]|uniref:YceH family protein n=1 Tax=Rosistilla oblonga TaxID=2527990 RepID=UPI003A9882BD